MPTPSINNALQRASKSKSSFLEVKDAKIKKVLTDLSKMIVESMPVLLKANAVDLTKLGGVGHRTDRLMLNEERIKNIAAGIKKVANLPTPSGKIEESRVLANGLLLEKHTVPLGVVGAIYESRPNVTFDIAALCLKSRNVCVLKGSSEAENSNHAAVMLIKRALRNNDLPADWVTLLPSDRSVVDELLAATKSVDILIPRGSAALIEHVRQHSQIPFIETGAGVCHTYVHKEANIEEAVRIVANAKISRPSVCNSLDTIIVDKEVAEIFLEKIRPIFESHKVSLFADRLSYKILKGYDLLAPAKDVDYDREFLGLCAAVKTVKNIDEALEHIAIHSTKHSEAIVSENKKICERFLAEVDAAVVYSNASTRFTDGEVFGLGAEIGISTQKLHARGPFALEKLITEKWILRGNGQVRE